MTSSGAYTSTLARYCINATMSGLLSDIVGLSCNATIYAGFGGPGLKPEIVSRIQTLAKKCLRENRAVPTVSVS